MSARADVASALEHLKGLAPGPADDTLELNPDNLKKRKLVYSLDLFRVEGSDPEYVIPLVKGGVTVLGATTR